MLGGLSDCSDHKDRRVGYEGRRLKLDSFDKQILRSVQRNSAVPLNQLAEKVGLSKSACWRRIKQLYDRKVIHKEVALLHQQAIGLTLTVYIAIRTDSHSDQWSKTFCEAMSSISQVLEIHRLAGQTDYLLKAVIEDMSDYDSLYKKIIQFDLRDVSASFVMETVKQTTELPV